MSSDEDQEDSGAADIKKTTTRTRKKRRYEQIQPIAEWLANNVIGDKADFEDMEEYAQELRNLGFHSVEFVKSECKPADVAAFDWMEPMHKRRFLARAGLQENTE